MNCEVHIVALAVPRGARIERFEVVRVLGAGQSGVTYLTTEGDFPLVLKEYTVHPEPGTKLTVDLRGTSVELPVVGGG